MEKDFMPSQLPSVTSCLRNTLGCWLFPAHMAEEALVPLALPWLVTDLLGAINF